MKVLHLIHFSQTFFNVKVSTINFFFTNSKSLKATYFFLAIRKLKIFKKKKASRFFFQFPCANYSFRTFSWLCLLVIDNGKFRGSRFPVRGLNSYTNQKFIFQGLFLIFLSCFHFFLKNLFKGNFWCFIACFAKLSMYCVARLQ